MILIRMLQDEYIAANNAGQKVFESKNYSLLFNFLEYDIEPITDLLMKYFTSVINPNSLELIDGIPDKAAIDEVKVVLEATHLFLRYNDYFSVIPTMLAYHLNLCLLRPAHIGNKYSIEWYRERLVPLVNDLLTDSLLNQIHPGDKQIYMSYPNKAFLYDNFEQTFYNQYIKAYERKDITYTAVHGVKYITYLQRKIKHYIYWLIDASSKHFKKLNVNQRLRLYRNIFQSDTDSADLIIKKRLSLSNPRLKYTNQLTDMANKVNEIIKAAQSGSIQKYLNNNVNDENADDTRIKEALALYNDNDIELAPDLLFELEREIQIAVNDEESALYEEYEAENLYQLLFLELEQLIKNNTIVKRCRLCRRYFITSNMNTDYCNNIAEGETQPCFEIGSTRAFIKKLDEDYALKIYNRAYKTHYARKMKGTMSDDDFNSWRDEARLKLESTRSGEFDIAEYEKWLKI